MIPYSALIEGSSIHMKLEKKKLLSLISSHTICSESTWRYFLTMAPSDCFDSKLYDVVTKHIPDNESYVDRLNYDDRLALLRNHPAMAIRLFDIKQNAIWEKIIMGVAQPFGVVRDFWRRVEFQLRGTPHVHCLLAIIRDAIKASFIESENEEERKLVQEEVEKRISACLTPRVPGDCSDLQVLDMNDEEEILASLRAEEQFDWVPPKDPYTDATDPRRKRFNCLKPNWDYTQNSDGSFKCNALQAHYRRLQIATQMHRCGFSCWKYNRKGNKECRYNYPYKVSDVSSQYCVICTDRDKKHRIRVRALPPRNNGSLNPSPRHVAIHVLHGGNLDIQYISNMRGAVEYCACYVSKNDEADARQIAKIVIKKFSALIERGDFTKKSRMKAVANTIIDCTKIGAPQACYFLLQLKIVKSSRSVIPVNTLNRSDINRPLRVFCKNRFNPTLSPEDEREHHEDMQGESLDYIEQHLEENGASGNSDQTQFETEAQGENMISNGVGSQLGKRDAYSCLITQQKSLLPPGTSISELITYSAFLTSFNILVDSSHSRGKAKILPPPLFQLNASGFVANAKKCVIEGRYVFIPLLKNRVLNLSPFIPVDQNSERSCYSTLLLHVPWEKESCIVPPSQTAVSTLQKLVDSNDIPPYLVELQAQRQSSETALRNNGRPLPRNIYDDSDGHGGLPDEFVDYDSDEDYQQLDFADVVDIQDPLSFELSDGNFNITNPVDKMLYTNKIKNDLSTYMENFRNENTISAKDLENYAARENTGDAPLEGGIQVPNWQNRKQELDVVIQKFNPLQLLAFNKAKEYIDREPGDENFEQLLMFLSGEGA